MVAEPDLLRIAQSYLQESVASVASLIDLCPQALREALQGLGTHGLLALRLPQLWGGPEVSEDTFQIFQEQVARYSGALAFLQTQHQSAAAMLVQSKNDLLKREYLPRMSNGQILVGVGFSQLRRVGNPPVTALPVVGGYQLNGQVPWVTGFGLFQDFIVGTTLPDGQAVFGLVPFVQSQESGGGISFSQPMPMAAMTSTNTVTATVKSWFLPQERVVFVKPAGWIHENDKRNVLKSTGLVLGCARAGLDILQAAHRNKPLPAITQAFEALDRELTACRSAIKQAQPDNNVSVDKQLQLRAWVIELAVRCAHAAVAVSSGAANSSHHAAQRVYREALVFTVSGQTTAVMEATLARLSKNQKDITC